MKAISWNIRLVEFVDKLPCLSFVVVVVVVCMPTNLIPSTNRSVLAKRTFSFLDATSVNFLLTIAKNLLPATVGYFNPRLTKLFLVTRLTSGGGGCRGGGLLQPPMNLKNKHLRCAHLVPWYSYGSPFFHPYQKSTNIPCMTSQ